MLRKLGVRVRGHKVTRAVEVLQLAPLDADPPPPSSAPRSGASGT
jgi:hypothetical protein